MQYSERWTDPLPFPESQTGKTNLRTADRRNFCTAADTRKQGRQNVGPYPADHSTNDSFPALKVASAKKIIKI